MRNKTFRRIVYTVLLLLAVLGFLGGNFFVAIGSALLFLIAVPAFLLLRDPNKPP